MRDPFARTGLDPFARTAGGSDTPSCDTLALMWLRRTVFHVWEGFIRMADDVSLRR